MSRHSLQSGFTLVELMVVVAIIGVLSAVAVPNFKKYQAKSKTAEAKLQLAALYTAQQSFYSDYDTYHICLKYMGYNPSGEVAQRVYAVGFGTGLNAGAVATAGTNSNIASTNGAQVADAAQSCYITATAGETFFAAGKRTGSAAAITTFATGDLGTAAAVDTFVAGAVGVIDVGFTGSAAGATGASAFTINEAKRLVQLRAGY